MSTQRDTAYAIYCDLKKELGREPKLREVAERMGGLSLPYIHGLLNGARKAKDTAARYRREGMEVAVRMAETFAAEMAKEADDRLASPTDAERNAVIVALSKEIAARTIANSIRLEAVRLEIPA